MDLLEATPSQDLTGLSVSIPLEIEACAGNIVRSIENDGMDAQLDQETIIRTMIQKHRQAQVYQPTISEVMASAFDPLSEPSKSSLLSRGPSITSFHNPVSTIAQDVAPYIRSIVSYDIRLEEQRLQLSRLLDDGRRRGKRPRTTRASRAALEGGNKANTRRERWFPKTTNFATVLMTGGEGWQDVALQRQGMDGDGEGSGYDGSRRSSLVTTGSEA